MLHTEFFSQEKKVKSKQMKVETVPFSFLLPPQASDVTVTLHRFVWQHLISLGSTIARKRKGKEGKGGYTGVSRRKGNPMKKEENSKKKNYS